MSLKNIEAFCNFEQKVFENVNFKQRLFKKKRALYWSFKNETKVEKKN